MEKNSDDHQSLAGSHEFSPNKLAWKSLMVCERKEQTVSTATEKPSEYGGLQEILYLCILAHAQGNGYSL